MRVLALDTSLKACSVAVIDGDQALAQVHEPLARGHAERIATMTGEALAAAGLTVRDLDRVGVVIGPGAFAGVRVGLAFARGLALGMTLDVVGVSSLAALAATAGAQDRLVAPVIDARRGQVYAGLFDQQAELLAPFVASPEEAAARIASEAARGRVMLVGDGAGLLTARADFAVDSAIIDIDARAVARLAAAAPAPPGRPSPLYLRPPDAAPGAPSPFSGLLDPAEAL